MRRRGLSPGCADHPMAAPRGPGACRPASSQPAAPPGRPRLPPSFHPAQLRPLPQHTDTDTPPHPHSPPHLALRLIQSIGQHLALDGKVLWAEEGRRQRACMCVEGRWRRGGGIWEGGGTALDGGGMGGLAVAGSSGTSHPGPNTHRGPPSLPACPPAHLPASATHAPTHASPHSHTQHSLQTHTHARTPHPAAPQQKPTSIRKADMRPLMRSPPKMRNKLSCGTGGGCKGRLGVGVSGWVARKGGGEEGWREGRCACCASGGVGKVGAVCDARTAARPGAPPHPAHAGTALSPHMTHRPNNPLQLTPQAPPPHAHTHTPPETGSSAWSRRRPAAPTARAAGCRCGDSRAARCPPRAARPDPEPPPSPSLCVCVCGGGGGVGGEGGLSEEGVSAVCVCVVVGQEGG